MVKPSFVRLLPFLWTAEDDFVRVFLAVGEDSALLIDTGLGNLPLLSMASEVTHKPIRVLNTHSDGDHIGGNSQFSQVLMHPDEWARYSEKAPHAAKPVPICEGDRIDLGDVSLRVLLTPGHTPGSICLLEEKTGALICGDTIQNVPIYLFGQGRDLKTYLSTLERLHAVAGNFQRIYPSHGAIEIAPDSIEKLEDAARKLYEGTLQPEAAPDGMPCSLYRWNGFAFYY